MSSLVCSEIRGTIHWLILGLDCCRGRMRVHSVRSNSGFDTEPAWRVANWCASGNRSALLPRPANSCALGDGSVSLPCKGVYVMVYQWYRYRTQNSLVRPREGIPWVELKGRFLWLDWSSCPCQKESNRWGLSKYSSLCNHLADVWKRRSR